MSTPEDYRAQNEGQLTEGQRGRLTHLVRGVIQAMQDYLGDERADALPGADDTLKVIRRPHNVFCIDGGRGAGKTHVLLTLDHLLKTMSKKEASLDDWSKVIDKRQWRGVLDQAGERRAIMPLRIIFPTDLDKQEYVMEAVFASLRADIDDQIEKLTSQSGEEKGRKLRTTLVEEIATGQYFARRFGVETVTRDSLNFKDLVSKWDDLNVKAANRTESWRAFIEEYLNWRGVCTLAILLDDSDQRPEVTYDILQTARNMFNHPRIITVIAGNTRAMRSSLINLGMRTLAHVMPALNQPDHPTGQAWRRAERRQVEQLIEKVLPEAKRFYLPPMEPDDFKKVLGAPLDQIITGALGGKLRDDFMKTKMLRAVSLEIMGTDLPDPKQAEILENYTSWWIFQTQYSGKLRPFSVRQAKTFGAYFAPRPPPASPPGAATSARSTPARNAKRLAVVLFENSSNYSLLQRFDDDDNHVVEWLGRQKLGSHWGEQRAFIVNGRRIEAGTYSHDFLCFRLDLGLSLPLRDNPDALVPAPLMPMMRGRKRMRQFYRPHSMPTRPRLLGLAGLMGHAAMPGNCLYFYHLNALPAVAFVAEDERPDPAKPERRKTGGQWEARLYATWPELLERDQDEALQSYLITVFSALKFGPEGEVPTGDLLGALREEATASESRGYGSFLEDDLQEVDPTQNVPLPRRARLSALVTDLRRAWHAIRIWDKSRQRGADEDSFTVTKQSMLSRIASVDRMELYTLEDFEKKLRRDNWLNGALDIFAVLIDDPDQFRVVLGKSVDFLHDLNPHRLTPEIEPEDWAYHWRRIGRLMCDDWPPHEGKKTIVKDLFPGDLYEKFALQVLSLETDVGEDTEPNEDEKRARQQDAAKARSIRAFIWLMYGIAPSLPAMIHADVVSRHKGNPDDKDQAALRNSTLGRLRRWSELLGSLTAILRYLKYQCLTMYIVSTLTHMNDWFENPRQQNSSADIGEEEMQKFAEKVAERAWNEKPPRPNGEVESPDGETASPEDKPWKAGMGEPSEFFRRVHKYFVSEKVRKAIKSRGGGDPLTRDLNIMPDASPSTLFGEDWLQHLFVRAEVKPYTDDNLDEVFGKGISYEGVFGETERWLWAAHDMTRVAWASFASGVMQPADPPPPTPPGSQP